MNKNLLAFAIGFGASIVLGQLALKAYAAETDRMYGEPLRMEQETTIWNTTGNHYHAIKGTGSERKESTYPFSKKARQKATSNPMSTSPQGLLVATLTILGGQANTTQAGKATTSSLTQGENALNGFTNSDHASYAASKGSIGTTSMALPQTTIHQTSKSYAGSATKQQTGGSNSLKHLEPTTQQDTGWRKTVATFYGTGNQKPKRGQINYDDGKLRRTSDGTPYKSDGMFCATYLVPLGTVIEVKRGKVTLRLVVRDRPARKNGHKIDIPTKTWDKFGAKRSIGVLPVEWRVVR
mgnify:CR=1 FL=1